MQAHELDLLTDILTASHKGTAYDRGWYRGTWNLAFTTDQERGFHIVTEGEAWIRMKSGDLEWKKKFSAGKGYTWTTWTPNLRVA